MLLIFSVAILLVVLIVLLIVVIKSTSKVSNLTYPIYEYVIKKAESKAQDITYDAMKKSREILVNAELEGTKVIAKEKLESSKIEKTYEEKLRELTDQTKKLLDTYANEAQVNAKNTRELLNTYAHDAKESLSELTHSLEESVSSGINENQRAIKEEAIKVSKQMTSTFGELEKRFREQIDQNLNKEFASAKEMVKTYRKQQLDLIDTYIVTLIERTAAITLQKKMSLEDHSELALRALEEAKSEGVFK